MPKLVITIDSVDKDILADAVASIGYKEQLERPIEVLCGIDEMNGRNFLRYATTKVNGVEVKDETQCYVEDVELYKNEMTVEEYLINDINEKYLGKRLLPEITRLRTAKQVMEKKKEIKEIKDSESTKIKDAVGVTVSIK